MKALHLDGETGAGHMGLSATSGQQSYGVQRGAGPVLPRTIRLYGNTK